MQMSIMFQQAETSPRGGSDSVSDSFSDKKCLQKRLGVFFFCFFFTPPPLKTSHFSSHDSRKLNLIGEPERKRGEG